MSYKFNSGYGAVICDTCRIMFDANLSYEDYLKFYGKRKPEIDICWRCKNKKPVAKSEEKS